MADHTVSGRLAEALDVTLHLVKSNIKAHKDKGGQKAKYLQLLPPVSFGQALSIDDDEHLDKIARADMERARMKADLRR